MKRNTRKRDDATLAPPLLCASILGARGFHRWPSHRDNSKIGQIMKRNTRKMEEDVMPPLYASIFSLCFSTGVSPPYLGRSLQGWTVQWKDIKWSVTWGDRQGPAAFFPFALRLVFICHIVQFHLVVSTACVPNMVYFLPRVFTPANCKGKGGSIASVFASILGSRGFHRWPSHPPPHTQVLLTSFRPD